MILTKRAFIFLLVTGFLFSCKQKPLPQINIYTQQTIHYKYKSPCVFEYRNGNDSIIIPADIKRRGGISINYLKPSYSISLHQPFSLCDLPREDDWILNANYIDKTFMRHKLSYDLFREMDVRNIAPQCVYVIFNLNDVYNGLYVLMEKMNAKRLALNKKDSMSVIYKDPAIFREERITDVQDSSNYYQQEYPDIKTQDKSWYAQQFQDFLMYSSDSVFIKEVTGWIDVRNFIDWHLLLLFTSNGDGVVKNFFLYKQNNIVPLKIALWDYDHSFGRDGANGLNMKMDITEMHMERNILIRRLMDLNVSDYNKKLKERYFLLRKKIFTEKNINKHIERNTKIIKPYLADNFLKWNIDGVFYKDDNDFYEEIKLMQDYVKLRLEYLDGYFNGM
ncbi:MAG: CotH kinase family protein [Fimbriimonadaceae bacterium]|nr:CotH kinase family protein [Chitinophagales bacterium]